MFSRKKVFYNFPVKRLKMLNNKRLELNAAISRKKKEIRKCNSVLQCFDEKNENERKTCKLTVWNTGMAISRKPPRIKNGSSILKLTEFTKYLFMTSKNETTSSPIHQFYEFKVLQNVSKMKKTRLRIILKVVNRK